MTTCAHEAFESFIHVAQLTETEGGPVISYSVCMRVRCTQCRAHLRFIGMSLGLSTMEPTASVDRSELRCPAMMSGSEKFS